MITSINASNASRVGGQKADPNEIYRKISASHQNDNDIILHSHRA